jgi:uncharacterized membrane protein
MNGLPLHPIIVHLPLVLALLAPLVLVGVTIWTRRPGASRSGWLLAGALQVAVLLGGLAALQSGERDEERVERVVPGAAIEAHEAAAQLFVAGAGVALALTLGALLLHRKGTPWAGGLAVIAAVAVAGLGVRTGHAGGQLVYQHNAGAAWAQAAGSPPAQVLKGEGKGQGHRDDD